MNKCLLCSSIMAGFILLFIIYNKYNQQHNILYLFIFLGIITSILNHGFDSISYKYIDRLIIGLNVFVFIYFINKINNDEKRYKFYFIIFLACISYLFSKLQKNIILRNSLHLYCHFLSVILLYFFAISNQDVSNK